MRKQNVKDILMSLDFWREFGCPIEHPHLPVIIYDNVYNNILDLGCGIGTSSVELLDLLAKEGKLYIADNNDEMVNKAKEKLLKKSKKVFSCCFDIEKKNWPLKDEYFNLIQIKFVLHQLRNINFLDEEINRILAKNGLLVLYTRTEEHNKEIKKGIKFALNIDIPIERGCLLETQFIERLRENFDIVYSEVFPSKLEFFKLQDFIKYFYTTYEYSFLVSNYKNLDLKPFYTYVCKYSETYNITKNSMCTILRKRK